LLQAFIRGRITNRPPDSAALFARLMPQTANATPIAVTSYGKQRDRDTSIAVGFDYHFVKPADPNALVALLDQIDQV
jgi:CheY-like chemotaxis protein